MRKTRLYTIYTRARGSKHWIRASSYSYHKTLAIRVFQSRLIDGILSGDPNEYRLRPVGQIERNEAK